jgi:hypothetical protein
MQVQMCAKKVHSCDMAKSHSRDWGLYANLNFAFYALSMATKTKPDDKIVFVQKSNFVSPTFKEHIGINLKPDTVDQ